jgi:hypothetical protein
MILRKAATTNEENKAGLKTQERVIPSLGGQKAERLADANTRQH